MTTGVSALVLAVNLCWQVTLSSPPHAEAGQCLLQSRSGKVSKVTREARDILPDDLFELGKQVFKNEEGLNKAVEQSSELKINYAGVPITLRVFGKDNAAQRLGDRTEDGSEYGLDTLLEARSMLNGKVNMIDFGGNYGAVSIAVYNKFPGLLRTVVVEPVAATYFFLRWNLHLNKVPHLTREEFTQDTDKPGIVALFGGISEKMDQALLMCSHPEWSMNAHFVEKFDQGWGCDCSYMDCSKVPGVTTDVLLNDYFGDATITLMKLDCEGCEAQVLPALKKRPWRVKRLVGELHMPEENLIDITCLYDSGRYFTKVCKLKEAEWGSSLPLGCNGERKICKW